MEMTDFLIKNKLEQIVENFKVSPKKNLSKFYLPKFDVGNSVCNIVLYYEAILWMNHGFKEELDQFCESFQCFWETEQHVLSIKRFVSGIEHPHTKLSVGFTWVW